MKNLFLILIFLLLLPWSQAHASMSAPSVVVNDGTQECMEGFHTGDECVFCTPPEGWKIVGSQYNSTCPEGYTIIDDLKGTCRGYQNEFCCSMNHSGGAGSCGNMIIRYPTKECAFVMDQNDCTAELLETKDWIKADLVNGELCPGNYSWLGEEVDCKQLEIENGIIEKIGKEGEKKLAEVGTGIEKKVSKYALQLLFIAVGLIILFSILLIVLLFYRSSSRR